jgi:Protein of unknown function (DUF2505)
MHFSVEQVIEAAPDGVMAALMDHAYYQALSTLDALGSPVMVDRRQDGDAVVTQVRYDFAGSLSPAVRAALDPAKLTWVQETTMHPDRREATFRIIPDHYADRLECSGSFTLQPAGEGTRQIVEGELVVHFPLVAGAVERAILSGLRDNLSGQATLLAEHVAAS